MKLKNQSPLMRVKIFKKGFKRSSEFSQLLSSLPEYSPRVSHFYFVKVNKSQLLKLFCLADEHLYENPRAEFYIQPEFLKTYRTVDVNGHIPKDITVLFRMFDIFNNS